MGPARAPAGYDPAVVRIAQSLLVTSLLVLLSLLALSMLGVGLRIPGGLQGLHALSPFSADEIMQVPLVMLAGAAAGVGAAHVYRSDDRLVWVPALALSLALACATLLPLAPLGLPRGEALAYRASVAFFCALAVALGSALALLARTR